MKPIHRMDRFRLQPAKKQEVLLNRHFGCVRRVYNHFLQERIEQYRQFGKSDNYNAQAATLTVQKTQEETAWLQEANSQSLQAALRHLDTAFVNFFQGRAKFPRFKSKKEKTALVCRSSCRSGRANCTCQSSKKASSSSCTEK